MRRAACRYHPLSNADVCSMHAFLCSLHACVASHSRNMSVRSVTERDDEERCDAPTTKPANSGWEAQNEVK